MASQLLEFELVLHATLLELLDEPRQPLDPIVKVYVWGPGELLVVLLVHVSAAVAHVVVHVVAQEAAQVVAHAVARALVHVPAVVHVVALVLDGPRLAPGLP